MKRQAFHSLVSLHASSIAFWLIVAGVFLFGVFLYNISYILSILLVAFFVSFACEPLIIRTFRILTRPGSIMFVYSSDNDFITGFVIVIPLLFGMISIILWQLNEFFF